MTKTRKCLRVDHGEYHYTEALTHRYSLKKLLLKTSQITGKHLYQSHFLNKLQSKANLRNRVT